MIEGLWLSTGRALSLDLFRYWVKIFALVFGMGVVSGIVMSYQFGTNWAVFSDRAGPIAGPLMAYGMHTFIVGGVGAWHLLRDRDNPHSRTMFSMAMWMARR